jgi:hypothetical protein
MRCSKTGHRGTTDRGSVRCMTGATVNLPALLITAHGELANFVANPIRAALAARARLIRAACMELRARRIE